MKKLFVLLAFVMLLGYGWAQDLPEKQPSFCYPSLSEATITQSRSGFTNSELLDLWATEKPSAIKAMAIGGIYTFKGLAMSMKPDCDCYGKQKMVGAWNDKLCLQDGIMLQERQAEDLIRPFCIETVNFSEQQRVANELCKSCPIPIISGNLQEIGCVENHPIMRQAMKGYKFDVAVEQCVAVDQVLLQVETAKSCNAMTYLAYSYGGIYAIIGIVTVMGFAYWWIRRH